MCNPVWTLIRAASALEVEVSRDAELGVTGSVVTSEAGGPLRKRTIGPGDFPLRLRIDTGTTHVVTVRAVSLGHEANLTVTSRVSGNDSRGPDVCRLEVDDSHPVAINTIMAGAA